MGRGSVRTGFRWTRETGRKRRLQPLPSWGRPARQAKRKRRRMARETREKTRKGERGETALARRIPAARAKRSRTRRIFGIRNDDPHLIQRRILLTPAKGQTSQTSSTSVISVDSVRDGSPFSSQWSVISLTNSLQRRTMRRQTLYPRYASPCQRCP